LSGSVQNGCHSGGVVEKCIAIAGVTLSFIAIAGAAYELGKKFFVFRVVLSTCSSNLVPVISTVTEI
jgi:hypothetical protein